MRKNLRALRYWVCACAISIGLSLLLISLVSAGEFNRSQSDQAIQERDRGRHLGNASGQPAKPVR